jgi:hypothetical protein
MRAKSVLRSGESTTINNTNASRIPLPARMGNRALLPRDSREKYSVHDYVTGMEYDGSNSVLVLRCQS